MLWIALVIGIIRGLRAARRTDIKPEYVIDVTLYAVMAGIVGAHLVSILLDLPYYIQNPGGILDLWRGILSPNGGLRGLSFHGGFIGAVGVVLLYTRRKGIKFWEIVDLLAPSLAIGYGITRIGCFLNGCCYGIPTSLPWAVRFHADGYAGELTAPSHPVQLYAAAIGLVIFFVLVAVEKRRRFAGQVFFSYVAMYSVYRFLIEILRKGVTAEVAFAGLTEAQIVSVIMFIVSGIVLYSRLRVKPDVSPIPQSEIRNPNSKGSVCRK